MQPLTLNLLPSCWTNVLREEFAQPYWQTLNRFLTNEARLGKTIFPPAPAIFNAFSLTPFERVRVVILGQDPYHGAHQAHGLSFSVTEGTPFPPSLRNIFKELHSDLGIAPPMSGDLTHWAQQGVFLLNAILTVEQSQAGSHQNQGWECFTDAAIRALNAQRDGIVFVLWGAYAQQKASLIDTNKHLIISSAHPSPLAAYRGFWGSRPFSKINAYFHERNQPIIHW